MRVIMLLGFVVHFLLLLVKDTSLSAAATKMGHFKLLANIKFPSAVMHSKGRTIVSKLYQLKETILREFSKKKRRRKERSSSAEARQKKKKP